jgi:ATP-dependent Clp protease protease subunit
MAKEFIKNLAPVIVKQTEPGTNSAIYNTETALYEEGIIIFDQEVTTESANCLQNQLQYLSMQGKEKVTIYIDSPGGSVVAGLAMLDTMMLLEKKGMTIETICRGMAASMASLLLMCGSKGHRFMMTNSTCMVHDLSGGTHGKYKDMEVDFQFSTSLRKKLIGIVAKRTGKSEADVEAKWFDAKDHFMDWNEAKNEGIIDEVISADYDL